MDPQIERDALRDISTLSVQDGAGLWVVMRVKSKADASRRIVALFQDVQPSTANGLIIAVALAQPFIIPSFMYRLFELFSISIFMSTLCTNHEKMRT